MGVSVRKSVEDAVELDKLATKMAKMHPEAARKLRRKVDTRLNKAIGRYGRKPRAANSGRRVVL